MQEDRDRAARALEDLSGRALEAKDLEPTPEALASGAQRARIEALAAELERRILTPLIDEGRSGEDLELAAAHVAFDVAALAIAAGELSIAARLTSLAVRVSSYEPVAQLAGAGDRQPQELQRLMHARWLRRRGRLERSRAILGALASSAIEPVIRESATEMARLPAPLVGAPTMLTFNSIGTRLWGSRDPWPDGSYVATLSFCFLFLPVWPLSAYRVFDQGGGSYLFLGREVLSPFARRARQALALALVAAIGATGWSTHKNSPEYRAERAIEAAEAAERAGGTDEAIAAHRAALTFAGSVDPERLAQSSTAIIDAGIAKVGDVMEPAKVDQVERLRAEWRALPADTRRVATERLVAAIERWGAQLGGGTLEAAEARARLYAIGAQVASADAAKKKELEARAAAGELECAGLLEREWPIEALERYARAKEAGAERGAAVLSRIAEHPSLVRAELAPTLVDQLAKWPAYATALERARAAAQRAEVLDRDAARTLALGNGDERLLTSIAAARPTDQEVVATLAAIRYGRGRTREAIAMLEAVGPPGLMIGGMRYLLASLYAAEGELEGAEAILERHTASRLPVYQAAQTRFESLLKAKHEELYASARSSAPPPELVKRMNVASDSERPDVYQQWVREQVEADPQILAAREAFVAVQDVVASTILLGTVRLRRAQLATGPARDALFAGAERAFLAIQQSAEGDPSFHLGLGQVYHRTGRAELGEKELGAVVAGGDVRQMLAAASVYRELGLLERARAVAKQVFERGEKDASSEAAVLLAMTADTLLERESWLRKADQGRAVVRTALRETEGQRLRLAGKLQEADARFAESAKYYLMDARTNGVSANNAALALQSRFVCTGDPAHLAKAVELLESAARLAPDNAITLSNLASVLEHAARSRVLGKFVDLRRAPLESGDVDELIDALVESKLRAEVLEALEEDPGHRRSLVVAEQARALAPSSPRAYGALLDHLVHTRDVAGLERLKAELASAPLDFAADARAVEEQMSGRHDAMFAEASEGELVVLRQRREQLGAKANPKVLGVLAFLEGEALSSLARQRGDKAVSDRAAAAYAQAHAAWPDAFDPSHAALADVESAVLGAVEGTPDQPLWAKLRRRHSLLPALDVVCGRTSLAARVRARPELAQAIAAMKASPIEVSMQSWAIAAMTRDLELERATAPLFERRDVRLALEIGARLAPEPGDAARLLAAHDARRLGVGRDPEATP